MIHHESVMISCVENSPNTRAGAAFLRRVYGVLARQAARRNRFLPGNKGSRVAGAAAARVVEVVPAVRATPPHSISHACARALLSFNTQVCDLTDSDKNAELTKTTKLTRTWLVLDFRNFSKSPLHRCASSRLFVRKKRVHTSKQKKR